MKKYDMATDVADMVYRKIISTAQHVVEDAGSEPLTGTDLDKLKDCFTVAHLIAHLDHAELARPVHPAMKGARSGAPPSLFDAPAILWLY